METKPNEIAIASSLPLPPDLAAFSCLFHGDLPFTGHILKTVRLHAL